MKLLELITHLTAIAEQLNPDHFENTDLAFLPNDAEIRIATQPTWPMESSVLQTKFVSSNADDIADIEQALANETLTESERGEAEEELTRLRAETEALIYIVEGSHIGYAKPTLWDTSD